MRALNLLVLFFCGLFHAYGQCDLTISPNPAASNCLYTYEEVVWTNLVNVAATDNDISKTSGGNNWNAGASSTASVSNFGFAFTVVAESNTNRYFGLSNSDAGVSQNSIEFAFFLRANGNLRVVESGSNRGDLSSYSANDTLLIAVDDNVVKYFQNGQLLYTSNITPTLPLVVDASLNTSGGTLQNATIANGTDGNFLASVTNAGTAPTYQWKLNGANVGSNASTYSNPSLVDGDVITLDLTPGTGGCSASLQTSNIVTLREVDLFTYSELYVLGTADPSACLKATEQVTWTDLVNLADNGNDLEKIQGGNNWNAGAASLNTVEDNGYAYTVVTETNTNRYFGLSSSNSGVDQNSIEYAIFLRANGQIRIVESGNNRADLSNYNLGDTMRVAIEEGVVKYYQNDDLLYISNITPTLPLLVDVSLNSNGSTLQDVIVANGNTGTFTAVTTNVGASPTYQWQLNGVNVGTNSSTYTNTALAVDDTLTVSVTPDLYGCTISSTSSPVAIEQADSYDFGEFYIEASAEPEACLLAVEQVAWTDLVNLADNGNDLEKIQGGNSWNAGAASLNTVDDNGYAYTVVAETNTNRYFGLSSSNSGVDQNSIEYAIFLRANGQLRIVESGNNRADLSNYNNGDTMRIALEEGVVKYYQNENLLYISNITPTLPLLVDVSLNSNGSTLQDVVVANGNTGTFNVITTNAGSNPTYQWTLNGVNVGSNSSTYVNTGLNQDDTIRVSIVPDLNGCSGASYLSAPVAIQQTAQYDFGDFYVEASADPDACLLAIEQVAWTDLVNLADNGNDLNKLQGGNSWNAGAASLNTVDDNGFAYTLVAETNTNRYFGLSSSNSGVDQNTIEYGIFLRANGQVRIVESGNNRADLSSYSSGDTMRVAIEEGVVKYYQNENLLYISNITPTLPLLVDVSLNDNGSTLQDVVVANGTTGTFNAITTNAGSNPTYQWKLNGANVGTNSSTYTNTGLSDGDIVQVEITPDLNGCGTAVYTSSPVEIAFKDQFDFGDFYVESQSSTGGVLFACIPVTWTDLVNLEDNGNDLNKLQGGNSWNAGAASLNQLDANSLVYTVVNEVNTNRYFGTSSSNGGSDQNSIEFAVFLRANGQLRVVESGTNRGDFGNYNNGDTIKVAFVNGVVEYYQNSTLLYTSGLTASFPQIVDVSVNNSGATLEDITIVHDTGGTFNATLTNAGSNPIYQWKLNGANVGSNSPSYSNPGLADGDELTVEITPDVDGCSSVGPFVAQTITIKDNDLVLPIELVSFNAITTQHEVQLAWVTASEENNDFFTIERSDDATNFSAIGRVPGAGNSSQTLNYDFTDDEPFWGISYYRLKQTDYDGQYSYSSIIKVSYNPDSEVTAYPNPVKEKLIVRHHPKFTRIRLELVNSLGQQVDFRQQKSYSKVEMILDPKTPPGVYYLRMDLNGLRQTIKVIRTR